MADMDSALSMPLEPIVPTFPVKRFTAEQYLEMIRAEILTEEDKVELIDGIITPMAPAGNEHTWEVHLLDQALLPARETHLVFVQGTVRIGKLNVFDPDITVVRRLGSEQRRRHPQAEDTELVIEVAKTSIKKDQTRKAAAYAEAGIPEYWIADINSKSIVVHRHPTTTGYQSVESFGADKTVTPHAFPNIAVRVGDIFGV